MRCGGGKRLLVKLADGRVAGVDVAVALLDAERPVGAVVRGRSADSIESGCCFVVGLKVGGYQVLFELRECSCADDRGDDAEVRVSTEPVSS